MGQSGNKRQTIALSYQSGARETAFVAVCRRCKLSTCVYDVMKLINRFFLSRECQISNCNCYRLLDNRRLSAYQKF